MSNILKGTERFVQGGNLLAATLRQLGLDAQSRVVTQGVMAAVQPIASAMIGFCPVRTDSVAVGKKKLRTGEMKASIRAKVISYPASGKAVGIIGPSGRAGRVAHLVEFGHLAVAPNKGQTIRKLTAKRAANGTTHVAPKPFIRPAVLSTLSAQSVAFNSAVTEEYLRTLRAQ